MSDQVSEKDLEGLPESGATAAPTTLSAAQTANLGQSNPIEYTAPTPEPLDIGQRLERGFMRTVESAPQMVGQGLYYLGSNFNPDQTKDQVEKGSSFGDRMAQMGLLMTERNQQAIAEKFPEKPDWVENIAGAGPMIGGIVLGTLAGAPLEAGAGLAIGSGIALNNSAFQTLRGQGKSMNESVALAAAVGMTGASTMMIGVGNFLKAVGAPVAQFAKGVVNGFTGGVLQSGATSAAEMATGVNPDHSPDAIKKAIGDAVATGVTFAVWGGPLGVHQALVQHAAVQKGIEQLGYSKKDAQAMTTKMMSQGMEIGIKQAEKLVAQDKDESRRIQIRPILKNKPIDGNGSPRMDSLDIPFTPTEPNKTEALTAELDSKKRNLELIKKDLAELKSVFKSNEEDLSDLDKKQDALARENYDKLKEEQGRIQEQIDQLKSKLAPKKVNPIADVEKEISRIKQGFRAGAKATLDDAKFIQKEFNRLVDQSDLDLNDKAKFRKNVPLTVENFEKELPNVLNKITVLENRAEAKGWREELQGLKLDPLGPDEKDIFKQLLNEKNFLFTDRGQKPILDKESLRNWVTDQISQQEPALKELGLHTLTNEEKSALDDLATVPWGTMTHEQRFNAYQILMTVYTNKVNENSMLSETKQKKFNELKTKVLKDIYGTDEVPAPEAPHSEDTRKENRNLWQKLLDGNKSWESVQVIPFYKYHFARLDFLHEILHDAVAQRTELQHTGMEKLDKTFYDRVPRKELVKMLTQRVDLPGRTGKDALRGDQLLDIYAHTFNDRNLAHLKENFSADDINTISSYVREHYPDAVKGIKDRFDYHDGEGYDKLNEVYRDMSGANMPKEPFYNPIRWLAHAPGKQLELDEAQSSKGMLGRANVNGSMAKSRVDSKLPFRRFAYWDNQTRSVMDRANYIAMAKAIRDANKVLYDPDISTAISRTMGDEVLKDLRAHIRDLAFDGHANDSQIENKLRDLRFAFSVSRIWGSPFSAGKVFTQLGPASTRVGAVRLGKWVMKYAAQMGKYDKYIDDSSTFMKNRPIIFSQQREWVQHFLKNGGNPALAAQDDFIKFGMAMHQWADKMVTRPTWLAQEEKSLEEQEMFGESDKNAARYEADVSTALTHPTGSDMYLPSLFRSNEGLKWFTLFKKAVNTNWNILNQANKDFAVNHNPFEYMGKVAGAALVPSLFLAALSLHRQPTAKEYGKEVLRNTLGTDIAFGYLVTAMTSRDQTTGAETPADAAFLDGVHAIFRKEPLMSLTKRDKIQDILATVDDYKATGFSNLYRALTLKMFKPANYDAGDRPNQESSDDTDNPYGSGRI